MLLDLEYNPGGSNKVPTLMPKACVLSEPAGRIGGGVNSDRMRIRIWFSSDYGCGSETGWIRIGNG